MDTVRKFNIGCRLYVVRDCMTQTGRQNSEEMYTKQKEVVDVSICHRIRQRLFIIQLKKAIRLFAIDGIEKN